MDDNIPAIIQEHPMFIAMKEQQEKHDEEVEVKVIKEEVEVEVEVLPSGFKKIIVEIIKLLNGLIKDD